MGPARVQTAVRLWALAMLQIVSNKTASANKHERWIGPAADDLPSFARPIGNVTAPQGRDVSLSCVVNNLGRYRVGWLKSDTRTILSLHRHVVTKNSRVGLSHDVQHTWTLHVRQLKASDGGCYMCQVNTSPMRSQLGCIDVQVPPDIVSHNSSSDVSVTEGDTARLVCHARGHPPPQITWRREDGDAIYNRGDFRNGHKIFKVDGSMLIMTGISRRNMGAYLCIARNEVPPAISKRIFVSVNFRPEIKVHQQLLGTMLGRDIDLDCYVEAHPATVNYWLSNRGEMLLGGQTKYSLSEQHLGYKVHLRLRIHVVRLSDIGLYRCVATNSLGTTESSIRLHHAPRPAPAGGGSIAATADDTSATASSRVTTADSTDSAASEPRAAMGILIPLIGLTLAAYLM